MQDLQREMSDKRKELNIAIRLLSERGIAKANAENNYRMELAKEIVSLYHGDEKSKKAQNRFKEVFQQGQIPSDIKTVEVLKEEFNLIDELVKNNLVSSKSEGRRILTQGGIKVNKERLLDIKELEIDKEMIVQVGKKKFIKLIIK